MVATRRPQTEFLSLAKKTLLQFLRKHRQLILYALSMAAVLVVLRLMEIQFLVIRHTFEIYAAIVAILFLAIGIWVASKLIRPKTIVVEKEIPVSQFVFNEPEFLRLGISKRELEVLELMSAGLSNSEIANKLFVSENTVKTHVTRILDKLDVRRRTQAVDKAKKLSLVR